MRQFDVFPNPSDRFRPVAPYVVVVQSHFLAITPATIVAPLLIDDGCSAYSEASVQLVFRGQPFILSMFELGGVDSSRLRVAVGTVVEYEYDIRRALDRLFTGF